MKAFYCDHFVLPLPDGAAAAEYLAVLEAGRYAAGFALQSLGFTMQRQETTP